MKNFIKVFALLSIVALPLAVALGRPSSGRAGSEIDVVQQALYEGGIALEHNDADALERYYANEWLSVSPTGAAIASGKGFSATRNGELVYESIKISEPVTRVYGLTAVSTSVVTVKGHHKGRDIGGTHRVSTALVKKGGHWQIVSLVTFPIVKPTSVATGAFPPSTSPQ
jgi:ketosteroid isomerase-like protein